MSKAMTYPGRPCKHRCYELLVRSRHGTVIQLALSCLGVLFFPLKVILNSEAKYLMCPGFLCCTVVGIKKIQPLFFKEFSSFKITTLSKCLAAALLVCHCIFQRELAVCPLLHLHCGCLACRCEEMSLAD